MFLTIRPEIINYITRCLVSSEQSDVELEMKRLSERLKKTPSKVTYENPTVPSFFNYDDMGLNVNIFAYGIDLPGSIVNPIGTGHFTDIFMDSFFGNYSYFMENVNKLSSEELSRAMRRREGYCQFSPIFAPVLGRVGIKTNVKTVALVLPYLLIYIRLWVVGNKRSH